MRVSSPDRTRRLQMLFVDPVFAKNHSQRTSAGLRKKLSSDREFAEAHADRGRKQICKIKADPEYRARHLAGVRAAAARRRAAKEAAAATKSAPAGPRRSNGNLIKGFAA